MKRFFNILLGLTMLMAVSCNKTQDTTQANRSVAQLTSFGFAANDTMPGLAAAVFTIDERIDTGLVWNQDSILYGTSLTRVVPRFTFLSTPDAAYLTMRDSIYVLTGYDTLDFTLSPIYLTIRSADKSTTKVYEIRATVHSADPDLYTWEQLTDGIYPTDDSEQRVVEHNGAFLMLASNGYAIRAYSSEDGASWTDKGTQSGLPSGTNVRQIISDGNTLYYGQDSTIYTSSDAHTWTARKTAHPVLTMLLYWNRRVWALSRNEENRYELAYLDGDTLAMSGLMPTDNFPVSDFATVTFRSSSLRERAMIIGGFAENGRSLNTRWNMEYMSHPKPEGTYRLQDFSIDRPSFTSLTGVSVIEYNHQLLLFGGVDDKMSYFGRDILLSIDEGLTWSKADTMKNQLPDVYQARQKQTALVRDNYIYLFGGQDSQTTYSDVYRGRLNSIDWK